MVKLDWFDRHPVTMPKHIGLPDFDLTDFKAEKVKIAYPNGLWDRLTLTLTFERKYGFYILQVLNHRAEEEKKHQKHC